jgi:predicted methyltransferase
VPTSKRPQINEVQYPSIRSEILKIASHGDVINNKTVEENVDLECMECRGTQISCMDAKSLVEPLEACRPQEGLKSEAPKHPEVSGRAIRRALHR